ncbi:MAG: hypothetical protein ACI4M6_05240 [Christensenellaceae bacterium]
MKNIAVFFGGVANEHDISVLTGVFVLNALDKKCFNAIAVYIHTDGRFYTGKALENIEFFKDPDFKKLKEVTLLNSEPVLYYRKKLKLKRYCEIDCAINALHGTNGEDGTLFALTKINRIPLVGSDMFSSSLAMDKVKSKRIIRDIPQAEFVFLNRKEFYGDVAVAVSKVTKKLEFPVIVKPSLSGSSIGISKAADVNGLKQALNTAFNFGSEVICESCLEGFCDINCAVCSFEDKVVVSELEKPTTYNEILTFADKYMGSKQGTNRQFPAKISKKATATIKEYSRKIYSDYGFTGIIRIDFLVKGEKVYLNEINSIPGSLAYYLFCETVADFTALLTSLIIQSVADFKEKYGNVKIFKSSVLSIDYKGAKK